MIPTDSSITSGTRDSILDQNSLNSIKTMGRNKDPQAVREVAKKFEAMFVQQMLKTMREASDVFAEGNFTDSSEEHFHRDLMDQQLVLNLTSGRGIGLADQFYQNMMRNFGSELGEAPKANSTNPQELNSLQSLKDISNYLNRPATTPLRASDGAKAAISDSQKSFMTLLKPYADKAAQELNVNADVLLAQAALETGWGKHVIHDAQGVNSFNLFNIKANASWKGDSVKMNTMEYANNAYSSESAEFKKYQNYAQSFDDYVALIKNSERYTGVLKAGADSNQYAEQLQQAGYATDPDYAKKIQSVLRASAELLAPEPEQLGAANLIAATSSLNTNLLE